MIGQSLLFSPALTFGNINSFLKLGQKDYKSIREFSWISPQGIIIGSANPAAIGNNVSNRPYFSDIINGKDWAVSDLVIGADPKELIFIIAKAIRNNSGDLQGIVMAVVDEARLEQELSIYRPQGGSISLLDRKGMLVYRYPRIKADWEQRNWLKMNPLIQRALNGNERVGVSFAHFEGKNRIYANVPISFGWVAAAGRTEDEAVAPIYTWIFNRAIIFALVLGAGFVLPIIFSRRIVRSVANLNNYIDLVAQGKYTFDPYHFIISEFQNFADKFKKMANQIQSREQELIKERIIKK